MDAVNPDTRSLTPVKASCTSGLNRDTSQIREKLHRVLSFTQLTVDTKPTALRHRPEACYRPCPPRRVPRGRPAPGAVMASSKEPLMPAASPFLQGGTIVFWAAAALIIPRQLTHRRRGQTPTRPRHLISGAATTQHPPLWAGRHGRPRVPPTPPLQPR